MSNQKLDRRKKYTRMVLKQSIIELLKQKSISKITVKEICELADINRSTFYAHYVDHLDLLEQIEEELIEDMNMYLSAYNMEKHDNALEITEKLIEYLATKQEECQILLSENSNSSFEKKVSKVARHFMMEKGLNDHLFDENTFKYLSAFIVSGSIQVIKVWLNNGMDKSPKEMATFITNIINDGMMGME